MIFRSGRFIRQQILTPGPVWDLLPTPARYEQPDTCVQYTLSGMTYTDMHDDLEAERLAGVLCAGLTAFAAAGREENLTRAAESLGMPQPTLSRALARLQDELGIRLFARAGRTVRLTREGRANPANWAAGPRTIRLRPAGRRPVLQHRGAAMAGSGPKLRRALCVAGGGAVGGADGA